MELRNCSSRVLITAVAVGLLSAGWSKSVFAHCDTLDGPVVQTARLALESGDVTPLLKWVQAEEENEIRVAFESTLAVRTQGTRAKELADMYFFETLVRIHRAGEGAPYTGLKSNETVDPAVALADLALESGSVDKLVDILTKAVAQGIRERYRYASNSQERANNSVGEGREFVESYVLFTHYVEGLHAVIRGAEHHDDNGGEEGHGESGH